MKTTGYMVAQYADNHQGFHLLCNSSARCISSSVSLLQDKSMLTLFLAIIKSHTHTHAHTIFNPPHAKTGASFTCIKLNIFKRKISISDMSYYKTLSCSMKSISNCSNVSNKVDNRVNRPWCSEIQSETSCGNFPNNTSSQVAPESTTTRCTSHKQLV